MNNGFGDAKEQNIADARELSGVTLTPTTTGSASAHAANASVLPFLLPTPRPPWRLLTSLILGNYCHHRQPSLTATELLRFPVTPVR